MTAASEPGPSAAARKSSFVFGEGQSAEIEQFRWALAGLAEIASSGAVVAEPVEIERHNLAALFGMLEARLGEIIGPDKVGHAFIDPGLFEGTWR